MAYQNILTPRIYLNIPEYLASTGISIPPVYLSVLVYAECEYQSKKSMLSFIGSL